MTSAELTPADLLTSAGVCRETLMPALGRDWSVPAGDLEWDCRRTLDHIVDTLFLIRNLPGQQRERADLSATQR